MLAWPSIAMLKINMPDVIITALVPEYTRPMAEVCPWIDQVIIDKSNEKIRLYNTGLLNINFSLDRGVLIQGLDFSFYSKDWKFLRRFLRWFLVN